MSTPIVDQGTDFADLLRTSVRDIDSAVEEPSFLILYRAGTQIAQLRSDDDSIRKLLWLAAQVYQFAIPARGDSSRFGAILAQCEGSELASLQAGLNALAAATSSCRIRARALDFIFESSGERSRAQSGLEVVRALCAGAEEKGWDSGSADMVQTAIDISMWLPGVQAQTLVASLLRRNTQYPLTVDEDANLLHAKRVAELAIEFCRSRRLQVEFDLSPNAELLDWILERLPGWRHAYYEPLLSVRERIELARDNSDAAADFRYARLASLIQMINAKGDPAEPGGGPAAQAHHAGEVIRLANDAISRYGEHARRFQAIRDHMQRRAVDFSRLTSARLTRFEAELNLDRRPYEELVERLIASEDSRACLVAIAREWDPPDFRRAEREMRESLKDFVFWQMMPTVVLQDGRQSEVRGADQNIQAIVNATQLQDMMIYGELVVMPAVRRLVDTGRLAVEELCSFFTRHNVGRPEMIPLLKTGFDCLLSRQWESAIHLLVPRLEDGLRTAVRAKGMTISLRRNMADRWRTLDSLIQAAMEQRYLSEKYARVLRIVLTTASDGLNLRNRVCHGFARPNVFSSATAGLVLHCMFALVRIAAEPRLPDSRPVEEDEEEAGVHTEEQREATPPSDGDEGSSEGESSAGKQMPDDA